MRCQRCGFEIEPGQTFCSMCGTEQSKAMRKPKKKIKSILGIIKITSTNHLKMFGNLGLCILLFVYILVWCRNVPIQLAYICLNVLLLLYILFQCLIPYKNPNASKSKKYKLGMRTSFMSIILLFLLIVLSDKFTLLDLIKSM